MLIFFDKYENSTKKYIIDKLTPYFNSKDKATEIAEVSPEDNFSGIATKKDLDQNPVNKKVKMYDLNSNEYFK